jgi:four helix bundle protein
MSQENYDLEERAFCFAEAVALSIKLLAKTQTNFEYVRQLARSSGSIGANYIEANEALGKKDFLMRLRISRKEAKESAYWIRLIIHTNDDQARRAFEPLMREAIELRKILSAIINKSQVPNSKSQVPNSKFQ